MQLVPNKQRLLQALPGLTFVILPIVVISEIIYWIRIVIRSQFFISRHQ